MAVGFRAVAPAGASALSSTVTIPATAVAGDYALLTVVQGGGQAITVTSSNGAATWFTEASLQVWNGTTNRETTYERVLTAADIGATVTVTFAATQIHSVVLSVWSGTTGRNATSAGTLKTTASTTNTFAAVTPTVADTMLVYLNGSHLAASSATALASTAPTGYTEDADQSQAGTILHTGLSVGHLLLAGGSGVAQTAGSVTLNGSARGLTLVLALAPADQAAPRRPVFVGQAVNRAANF